MSSAPSGAKPSLVVLLGAGVSIGLGVPSTKKLTQLSFDALRECDGFIASCDKLSMQVRIDFFLARCRGYFGRDFNFEHLLHLLEVAETLAEGLTNSWPSTLRPAEGAVVESLVADLKPLLSRAFCSSARRWILFRIHEAIAATCEQVRARTEWPPFQRFFQRLSEGFDLSVATLNYDNTVEQALNYGAKEQGFLPIDGESTYRFSERTLVEAPRLMHLHGSIHFGYRGMNVNANRFAFEDDWEQLYWHETSSAAQQLQGAKSASKSQAGRVNSKGPLLSGLDKSDKMLVQPFESYLRRFSELIRECPRLLVVGYSFGDNHVNSALQRMASLHGDARRIVNIGRFDPVMRIGAWNEFENEALMYQRWAGEKAFFEPFDVAPGPLRAKSGYLQVYFEGLHEAASLENANRIAAFLESIPFES